MHRVTGTALLLAAISWLTAGQSMAWFWEDKTLVVINDQTFTKNDFEHWWENWKEKDTPFPSELDPFIDWHLLVGEAVSMQLYTEPDYRHKVETFLKARALMLLKAEAVDSRIQITEKDLKDRYAERYVPLLRLQILSFQEEDQARAMAARLASGEIDLAGAPEEQRRQAGILRQEEAWLRPMSTPDAWKDQIKELPLDGVSKPVPAPGGPGWVILRLEEKRGAEKADFELLQSKIRKELWEVRQGQLTEQLVSALKKKYEVSLDEDLFARIGPGENAAEILDSPLVTTNRGDVTVKIFLELLKKEQAFRGKNRFQQIDPAALKNMILNNMISQTVTSWEALDRRYEEKEPFKWVYQFYCQHRLIKELENRLFWPKVRVGEDEVKTFYLDHQADFAQPEMVNIIVVEDEPDLMAKLAADVRQGQDFFQAVSGYFPHGAAPRLIPLHHLSPPIREVVETLGKGEVAGPVPTGENKAALLKLFDRKESRPIPLRDVQDQIQKRLKADMFAHVRQEYLDALRSRSSITKNTDAWEDLKKEHETRGEGDGA